MGGVIEERSTPVTESGCWIWLGPATSEGYGTLTVDRKTTRAHRYSLAKSLGRELLPGMFACHKCDTRLCVNPSHLFEGTRAENMKDMTNKNRQSKGTKHGSCKLSERQVLEIRDDPDPHEACGRKYGVSHCAVRRIRSGVTWRWLKKPDSSQGGES